VPNGFFIYKVFSWSKNSFLGGSACAGLSLFLFGLPLFFLMLARFLGLKLLGPVLSVAAVLSLGAGFESEASAGESSVPP